VEEEADAEQEEEEDAVAVVAQLLRARPRDASTAPATAPTARAARHGGPADAEPELEDDIGLRRQRAGFFRVEVRARDWNV